MFLKGSEDYLIPCVYKKIFDVECLGCGIQRAAALLFEGEFVAAFKIYPAIYTLILLVLFLLFNLTVKFRFDRFIKISLIVLNVLIIVISYVIKMSKHL